ncbi:MAG: NAD(P)(+) transhydrogenase (Re/Si-specific) subunit beta [Actinomycetes bacterium]
MTVPIWAQLVDLFAAICFVLALKGLSGPKTARNGNLIGAFGGTIAVISIIVLGFVNKVSVGKMGLIILAIVIGFVIGFPIARKVKMTAMPQLVALFNGVGGLAAALVSIIEFMSVVSANSSEAESKASLTATVFTVLVGSVSFSGSMLTFLKLQELITTRPIVFAGGRYVTSAVAIVTLVVAIATVFVPSVPILIVLLVLSLICGLLLVMPVGGADVPIVISLLNAFTGLSVAASGYVLNNVLLIVAGTLVGASGTILTQEMAKAMGRPLTKTLFGAFTAKPAEMKAGAEARSVRTATPDDVAIMLTYASKVIIVPGYGLAVAQAQHTIRELVDLLTSKGIECDYAIHPVAGRMPGHMNVLLAEANVPYDQLKEMDEINPQFGSTDVVVVVGANDVVNPAAESDPTAPIYGMPILQVGNAAQVVFLKRSMRPGFAGIENELLFDPKTSLLFGDAKDSLTKVVSAVKAM